MRWRESKTAINSLLPLFLRKRERRGKKEGKGVGRKKEKERKKDRERKKEKEREREKERKEKKERMAAIPYVSIGKQVSFFSFQHLRFLFVCVVVCHQYSWCSNSEKDHFHSRFLSFSLSLFLFLSVVLFPSLSLSFFILSYLLSYSLSLSFSFLPTLFLSYSLKLVGDQNRPFLSFFLPKLPVLRTSRGREALTS